jgi:Zn-dependent protease with chaperone function/tetratricopeptide (TPR) repeat protein
MTILRADYFDGKSSLKHPVTMMVGGGKLRIVGRDVDAEFNVRRVRRSLPVAGTPRWFYLPGGGACVTTDIEAAEHLTRKRRYERMLVKWESHPVYAGLAVAMVAVLIWMMVDFGVPAAAEAIATRIPVEAEATLGRESLAGLDRYMMKPSRLPAERQRVLREKLAEMVRISGEPITYQLEFRASPVIGANAFALPSGIVIMTDELVKMAKGDREVLGVLAHELGHLHHRHTMRRLLEASATALVIAGVTGDIASASSLAASAPTLLLQTKYSRGNEREADVYAIAMLRKSGINPRVLGDILARMEAKAGGGPGLPDFLSSHPATQERVALSHAGSPEVEPEPPPELPRLTALDPVQREIVALAAAKDFAGLERVLGSAWTANESGAPGAENALRALGKLPGSARADLERWAKQEPSSYAAALALAGFHTHQAVEARGYAAAADTPKENLMAMRQSLALARVELERAVQLSPNPYVARRMLMGSARHRGDRAAELQHYAEALKLAPKDVELRLAHMTMLEPDWGGSQDQMAAYLEESRRELTEAELARLAARLPAARARERAAAGNWDQALSLLDESIALDATAGSLCERSRVLGLLKRSADAIADVTQALAKMPDHRSCLRQAVRATEGVEDPNEVVRVLNLVLESDPASVEARSQRGFALEFLGKADLARKDFEEAARLGDEWADQQLAKKK